MISPAEYGRALALREPSLTEAQVETAARILAGIESEDVAA